MSKPQTMAFLTQYRKAIPQLGLYMRALSQHDLGDQETFALTASNRERKALRDATSALYQAHIAPLADLTDAELEAAVLAQSQLPAWREAIAEIPTLPAAVPTLPDPVSDDLERRESVALEGDEDEDDEAKLDKLRLARVDEKIALVKTRYDGMTREERVAWGERIVVSARTNLIYARASKKALVMLTTYDDEPCTKRTWKIEDDPYIPADLVAFLVDEYAEVGNVSPGFLTAPS